LLAAIWYFSLGGRLALARAKHGTRLMADRSDEFRKAANDCLELARRTPDAATRVSLLGMAQRWFDLAKGSPSQAGFDAAVREFNAQQMNPKQAVVQQQQQRQPKGNSDPD
jgi:hypothetical protein